MISKISHINNGVTIVASKNFQGFVSTAMVRVVGRYSPSTELPPLHVAAQAKFYEGREGKTFFLEPDENFWEKLEILDTLVILLGIMPTEQILRWVFANRKNFFAWIGNCGGKMIRENLPANLEDRIIFEPDKELVNLVGRKLLGTNLLPRWAEEEGSAAEELKKLLDCHSWEKILRAFVIDNSAAWDEFAGDADVEVIRGCSGRR